MVRSPAVLSLLNSLLEHNGTIELPGRVVRRHPDTIVVFTANEDYYGCKELNAALKDRWLFGDKMNTPSKKVMAQRLSAKIKYAAKMAGKNLPCDDDTALAAASVVWEVARAAKKLELLDVFGMRSLLFWGLQLCMGHTDKDTFLRDVIYKMTRDDENVAHLEEPYMNSPFASKAGQVRRKRDGFDLSAAANSLQGGGR